jgi:hypothetical protein
LEALGRSLALTGTGRASLARQAATAALRATAYQTSTSVTASVTVRVTDSVGPLA